MLFRVVSTQPSERWTCAMRNASMWPLKGLGDAAHVPVDAKGSRVEIDGQCIAHLRDTRAVEIEMLVARAGVLAVGADDVAPVAAPERR
ncbi:MAG: hypothetical protein ACREJ0_05655 [Geminicoccaceae bacterium]